MLNKIKCFGKKHNKNNLKNVYGYFKSISNMNEYSKNALKVNGTLIDTIESNKIEKFNNNLIDKNLEFKTFKQNVFKKTFYGITSALSVSTLLTYVCPVITMECALPLMLIGFVGGITSILLFKHGDYKTKTIKIDNTNIKIAEHSNRNLCSYAVLGISMGLSLAPTILMANILNPLILPMALVISTGTFVGACYFGNKSNSLDKWTNVLYGSLFGMVSLGLLSLITFPFFPQIAGLWFSIEPYLGIALFTCITAHDNYIANREYEKGNLDDLNVSVQMFLNFMNILIRFIEILAIMLEKK